MAEIIENRRFNRLESELEHIYCNQFGTEPMGDTEHTGFLKCKLGHAHGYSVIVPDQLFLEGDPLTWIQPLCFTPNLIYKTENDIDCFFHVDISMSQTVRVNFSDIGFIRCLDDGSQLFRCKITGCEDLGSYATGSAFWDGDSPVLNLFHHTTDEARRSIIGGQEVWGSRWNIQGNKELGNVGYAYFTCLDQLLRDNDLKQIAMANDGVLHLMRDDFVQPAALFPGWEEALKNDILCLKIYRESTLNRTAALSFHVDAEHLAPQHILKHAPEGQPVYYQVCCPFIYRVGLEPDRVLAFDSRSMRTTPDANHLKRFDYIIIGDATSVHGLIAPYDEEHTDQIFKIERTADSKSILAFWVDNANQDHFSGKVVDLQQFTKSKFR